ncbi:mediator of RNA polymerase II transcription subunit 11 isoform X1 [Nematostella vectensis]|uniref:mediator of RNA polymerase II transcription subunit 11 isoform X1 n=2 Tax=Nematostella vectensis TaxID=45351 RepID=UPI0020776C8D|nr:mediator of RNA polymerase II transcription subunit 11 isoform X1 [Nematostella vectensis]
MAHSRDRLKQLEEIEKDIVKVMQSAGETIAELSNENPSEDMVNMKATEFVKSLEGVEKGLTEQINYLTQVATGQPHEGSTYGVDKDFELATSRTAIVKEQLQEVQKILKNPTVAKT